MKYQRSIIEYCKKNRVSTTEVADALGKKGVIKNIFPIISNQYKVGKIKTIFASYNSNYEIHDQIQDVNEGDIIFILTFEIENRAVIGDLIAKYLILYKGITAIIIDGFVRDLASLKKDSYPIWCKGSTPLGCFNSKRKNFPKSLKKELEEKYNNGIAICDEGGVTIIESKYCNKLTLKKLEQIELQEDIWFYCLDTLKWNTKEIVCEKRYLDSELIPDTYKSNLKILQNPLDDDQ